MRFRALRLAVAGSLAGSALLAACTDAAQPAELKLPAVDGARIAGGAGARLTPPSTALPTTIVANYVQGLGGRVSSAPDLVLVSQSPLRRGVTHARFEQRVAGLRVHGAYVKATFDAQGALVHIIDATVDASALATRATASDRDALAAAMNELGYDVALPAVASRKGNLTTFTSDPVFYRAPTAERVAWMDDTGALREGYLVETWSGRGNQLDHTLVGERGQVISTERRTNNETYNVFTEDPSKSNGAQTTVTGTSWLTGTSQTTINISGNNAHAYLDADANNSADAGGTAVTNGVFNAVADLTAQPSTANNRNVAVQNLFYFNNVMHDSLYGYGFTEAEGNFQNDNFGKGGLGNDAVNAEAQDGSGTDNANFSTPTDGSAPRMQMYLWSGADPTGIVTVTIDASTKNDYGVFASSFGGALTSAGVTGPLAVYNDNTGVTSDACEAATVALTGKVAIVDRGTCNFTDKVLNAQKAGAVGVIIVNNASGAFSPGGTERRVKIPSGMVTTASGASLKTLVNKSSNLHLNPIAPIKIDGDVDADIVFHEYGHGLTWRMIGSMSGPLAGALGEGASDVVAFLHNGDDVMGEYSWDSAEGIRRFPYGGDGYGNTTPTGLTYKNVDGGEVHNDGEIYAAAMWRAYQNYLGAGLSASDMLHDFVDGMNYTPAGPTYEQMRDGLVTAAALSGRECLVWKGFAALGIGAGSKGTVNRRGGVSITESFQVPAKCQ